MTTRDRRLLVIGLIVGVVSGGVGMAVGGAVIGGSSGTTVPRTAAAAQEDSPRTTPAHVAAPTTAGLPPTTSTTTTTTTQPPTTTVPDLVEEALAAMSLEQKVEQLFVVEIFGTSADEPSAAARDRNAAQFGVETGAVVVETYAVGGVIYFGQNVDSPAQVAALSGGLQAAAARGSGVGLVVAIDQEGGRVNRIRAPATVFPAALDLGATGDPELAAAAAAVTGTELAALGINQVYAPVADVVTAPASQIIGDRSFGGDPELVAAMVAAAVRGYAGTHVAPVVKHFPGHGGTSVDSHRRLPVIPSDRAAWEAADRLPFAAAVDAGVPVVMVGHIAMPALDPTGVPATLSAPVVTGELRHGLGFDGVVVTDSLRMGGVRSSAPDAEIAVRALQAGADMLLLPHDFRAARAALIEALASGELSIDRLNASVRRILALKSALGVLDPPPPPDPADVAATVGSAAHAAVLAAVVAAIP